MGFAMTMRSLAGWGLGLGVIVGLVLFNTWAFPRWLNTSYVDWYLASGSQIGLLTGVIALSWGDMNRHVGLISAHPLHFVGSNLQLVGLALLEIGTLVGSESAGLRRRTVLDVVLTSVIVAMVVLALIAWLVVVVPVQYFVYLVCGAPGRIFATADRRVAAVFVGGTQLRTKVLRAGDELPKGWWLASIASKPVTATGMFASLFFVLLNKLF